MNMSQDSQPASSAAVSGARGSTRGHTDEGRALGSPRALRWGLGCAGEVATDIFGWDFVHPQEKTYCCWDNLLGSFVGIIWCFFWMINQQHPNYMCLSSLNDPSVTWLVNTCHLFLLYTLNDSWLFQPSVFQLEPCMDTCCGSHGFLSPWSPEFIGLTILLNFMNWSMTK